MKKLIISALILLTGGTIFFLSCTNKESAPAEIDDLVKQAENEAVTEAVLEKIDAMINKEITALESFNYNVQLSKSSAPPAECSPEVTVETPEGKKFPKTITLDWGTGCLDADSNLRAGQVVVHITGPYWVKNTVRYAKLVDYRFNDLYITGDRMEKNTGADEDGYICFDVNHSEKIKNEDGDILLERDLMRLRKCNRGEDLTTNQDDEIWVTGTAKVYNNGKDVTRVITVPLYKRTTCQHFQSGIITTFIKKEKKGEFNYGDGECDNIATWTNGNGTVTKTITLKTWINHFSVKP